MQMNESTFALKMCILEFNETLAKMSAIDFLDTIIKPIQPKNIVVGYDFKFGAKRQGIKLLQDWGAQYDINCIEVQPITIIHRSHHY